MTWGGGGTCGLCSYEAPTFDESEGQWLHFTRTGGVVFCVNMQWDDGMPVGRVDEEHGGEG